MLARKNDILAITVLMLVVFAAVKCIQEDARKCEEAGNYYVRGTCVLSNK
jgi:hypothetical protein